MPLAAPVALGTALRRSRLFHPRGVVLSGHAEAIARQGATGELACALHGPIVARFSGAFWTRREGPDLLGCAIRFLRDPAFALDPGPDDQDLLFATVRAPLLLPVALVTTDPHDFLRNVYFGVSPFTAPGLGRIALRVVPMPADAAGRTREEKLLDALGVAPLSIRLDVRPYRHRLARYEPLVSIVLRAPLALDQRALRFDPFRIGRGIEPAGMIQHLRGAAYAAGQRVRKEPRRVAGFGEREDSAENYTGSAKERSIAETETS